jgi:hypothetical protein
MQRLYLLCLIYFSFVIAPLNCVNRFYADACDNKIYYECWEGVATKFNCAPGTVWDSVNNYCNWAYLVNAIRKSTTLTTSSSTQSVTTPTTHTPTTTTSQIPISCGKCIISHIFLVFGEVLHTKQHYVIKA